MSILLRLLLVAALATVAGADEPKDSGSTKADALAVLKKAAAATKAIKLVQYRADYSRSGWLESRVPALTGTVLIGERSQYDVPQFRCRVKMTKGESQESVERTIGCDGDLYFLVDPETKTVHADMDPAVLGSASRDLQRVILRQFGSDEPFKDEIESEELELAGSTTVGGVECFKIKVKGEGIVVETILSIGMEDYLPRGVRRIYNNPEGGDEQGSTELTLTKMKVNPKLEGTPFAVELPAGYTKTDDFAP